MTKLVSITEDFKSSVSRLEEVLSVEKTDIVRDSAIQRFEIAFEMAWKTVKAFLEESHNAVCSSPKTCFKDAYRHKLIDYDEFWLKIADLRNETAHTYKEAVAEKVYAQLPEVLEYLKKLFSKIKEVTSNQ